MPQMPCVCPRSVRFIGKREFQICHRILWFFFLRFDLLTEGRKKLVCLWRFCCSQNSKKISQTDNGHSIVLSRQISTSQTRCRFPIILFDHHRRRRHEWLYDFIMACLVRCLPLFSFFVFDDVVITNNSSVYPACQYRFSPSHLLRLLLCFL